MIQPIPFTKEIFWDADFSILEIGLHDSYIIERVLNFGMMEDWDKLKEIYSKEEILSNSINNRNIKRKTATFLATIWDIPITKFKCFSEKQFQKAPSSF